MEEISHLHNLETTLVPNLHVFTTNFKEIPIYVSFLHDIISVLVRCFGVLVFQWGVFNCQRFHAGRRLLLFTMLMCFVLKRL